MKKKIIISVIALALAAAVIFGAVTLLNNIKSKAILEYTDLANVYMEAAKKGNNSLMEIAAFYEFSTEWGNYEAATENLAEKKGNYNGLSFELKGAYDALMAADVKYNEAQEIKDAVIAHYEKYKTFEDRILNQTEANFNENYGRTYKDWQKEYADETHGLRSLLGQKR